MFALIAAALFGSYLQAVTGLGYIGIQSGYSWMNLGNKTHHDYGLNSDFHAGYLFSLSNSLYLGPEIGLGFNFYSPKNKDIKIDTNYYAPIMARLQWQVEDDLYLFGKAGVTYVKQTLKYSGLSDDRRDWQASFSAGVRQLSILEPLREDHDLHILRRL